VINVPNASSNDNAFYRIDYSPPFGFPEPNTTIPASEIGKDIKFSRALPGTEYNFWLYYTNSTHQELLTWTVNITTGEVFARISDPYHFVFGSVRGSNLNG